MKRPLSLFLFCLLAIALSHAQSNAAVSTPSPTAAAPSAPATVAPDSAQAPILEYSPPPAQFARAKAYSQSHYTHFFVNALYGFLVLLFILRWRIAPKFRDLAERVSKNRFVQLIIFAPLILLTINFLTIPSDVWDEALQRAYGLSVQQWPAWFSDWITNTIIMLIIGTVLVAILYAVIRRSPRRWWFYFWLASIPVMLIVFFIQPVVIDPLFFKFTPLADTQPALVAGIEQVTHRGGINIPRDRMFLMNASTKTTSTNAYVTGFGSSKRVVIWDTTVAKATIPETLFVFGHEMGHYVLLHIPKEMGIISLILLFLLYLGYRLANGMLARWGYQWGIRDITDWASLPALIFVITLLGFLATPAFNAVSRHFEHEADRYGIEVTHGIVPNANQVAAHYFEKSGELNLSDPDPNWFTKAWFFDHPTRPERVHFVATYDPWSQGKEPEYVK
ncbi:MAG: M48 family metallopeptidase [Terriglobales bacterium]